MKSTWTGLTLCGLVIYFGLVHSMSNPLILLNAHAVTLVLGGTIAIAFLTYSRANLTQMMGFIVHGFLFRLKKTEIRIARDLISHIDTFYGRNPTFPTRSAIHPFLAESFLVLMREDLSVHEMKSILTDRRNSIKRRYIEDAKMLNNIAKYPPHLGLLGAASGMIEMMSGLGKGGIDTLGASMAIALSATLWGVGLNNFVFLPLSDNSMKVSEDEIYMRDMIIECCMMMKKKAPYRAVIRTCLNRLNLSDRYQLRDEYNKIHDDEIKHHAA